MTYEAAQAKANKLIKENNRQIYFIMGKNNNFDVITGWSGRDEALKNGWVFPKYNMRLHRYVTDYNRFDMDIID